MNRPFLTLLFCLIQIVAFGQDLIVTEVVTGGTSFARHEEFVPAVTFKNDGIVDISDNRFINGVFLSVDNVLDSADPRIGYPPSFSAIASGESKTFECICSLNVPPGNYFLIIQLDRNSAIAETDEDNNIYVVPGLTITAPDVDWQFTSLSTDNPTTFVNDVITYSYQFKNNGLASVGYTIFNSFYISTDNILDAADIRLGYRENIDIEGPDVFDAIAELHIPNIAPGEYFIIGKLDDQLHNGSSFDETNEANNIATSLINVVESDADLEVMEIVFVSISSSSLYGQVSIKNNGATGVGALSINAYLSTDGFYDPGDEALFPTFSTDTYYIGGGETIDVSFNFPVVSAMPGAYYLAVVLNPDNIVNETDITNNEYISSSPIVYVEPPPVPSIALSDGSFIGSYDNTDTELNLTLNFTSNGTGYYSGYPYYEIKIKDATNAVVYSDTKSQLLNLAENESETHDWLITMNEPLPIGNYTFEISCSNSFDCYTNDYTLPLIVDQAVNFLTGNIQGEDGTPITKGKLFLYQKDDFGVVKFINKVVPTSGSEYSFQLDSHQHTLYFIPDRILFPDYVPTILGKTMMLNENSFITISESTDKLFEILKIVPLASGNKSITGNISSATAPNGRSAARVAATSIASLPVILLSSSGEPVAITETDGAGHYEFNNLPSGNYNLLVSFELDQTLMETPIAVDITLHNAKVDLIIGAESISSVSINLQEIAFDALPTKQFTDLPFDLSAVSSSGLPVSYISDNPLVATVTGNTVTILAAGSVVITAEQSGNSSFEPATPVQQALTINKANQTITFQSLSEKKAGDPSFELSATASSGLPITFSNSNPGVASINGNIVTILTSGTTNITASQSGNNNFNGAIPVVQKLTIGLQKTSQEIIFNELPVKFFKDASFTLEAKATSGLTVTYTSSDTDVATIVRNKVTIKAPGTTMITAQQAGNIFYEPATAVTRQLTIDKAHQSIDFGGFPQTVSLGSNPFILGASSSSGLPVSYSSNNSSVATVNFNTVTITGPGWVRITASQSGDELYKEAVSVSRDLYVSRELQSIAFGELPEKSIEDEMFTLDAIASSGLPVAFTSSNLKVAVIIDNRVSIKGPGTTVITASQAGNETYEPVSVNRTLVVNMITTVSEVAYNTLSVYPNPVLKWLTISLDGFALNQLVNVFIYDSRGQMVIKSTEAFAEELSFNLETFSSGIYNISIVQGKTTKGMRFLKY